MLKSLFQLLFPETCAGCGNVLLNNEKVICIGCRHNMPFTQQHANPENETYCRFYGRLAVEHASAMLYFHKKGIVQHLIHNLKYKGNQKIGSILGDWYANDLLSLSILKDVDMVIPVPLHKKRLRERGFNQVTTFGESLAAGLGVPYNENVLMRKIYSITQTAKNSLARGEIKSNLFEANAAEEHTGKHFLLIDDVVTTGATLEACGKALLKIPGARLSIVTIAYAHS